jgi:hypothetical protein
MWSSFASVTVTMTGECCSRASGFALLAFLVVFFAGFAMGCPSGGGCRPHDV